METATMGRVSVEAKMENFRDVLNAKDGSLPLESIRSVMVSDALVDMGAKLLCLPKRLIQQLGLTHMRATDANTAVGKVQCNIFSPVRVTIHGRDCQVDVAEVPDECPVLVGFIALELLDFVVDPKKQRLVSDPWVGEHRTLDMF